MKRMKKLASIVLAMVMIFAMAIPVMAAGKGSITIKDQKGTGHTYNVYQIFKGEYSGDVLVNVDWGSSITEDGRKALLAAFKPVDWDSKNEGKTFGLPDLMKELDGKEEEIAQKLADTLAQAGMKQSPVDTMDDGRTTTIELDDGYYLVVDSGANGEESAISDFIVQVVGGANVPVTAKSDVPTSEKKVKDVNDSEETVDGTNPTGWQDSADYDIGDEVPFQLKGTMPENIADYSKYKMVFHDTQSEGLVFNKDSVKVYLNGTQITNKDLYKVTVPGANGCTFDIEITDVKELGKSLGSEITENSVVTVEYTSTLTGDSVKFGAEGNTNTMYMEYSNNPNDEGTGTTPRNTVTVFTYKTVIDKVNQDGDPLMGAKFTLYKYDPENPEAEEEGKYSGYVKKEMIVSNDGTTFTLNGLDDGKYILVESTTPEGYNTMADVHFTVTASHDANSQDPKLAELKVDVTEPDDFEFSANVGTGNVEKTNGVQHSIESGEIYGEVINQKGTTLPETGGIGTTIFYVVGAILVVGAVVLLVTKKRMSNEQ